MVVVVAMIISKFSHLFVFSSFFFAFIAEIIVSVKSQILIENHMLQQCMFVCCLTNVVVVAY